MLTIQEAVNVANSSTGLSVQDCANSITGQSGLSIQDCYKIVYEASVGTIDPSINISLQDEVNGVLGLPSTVSIQGSINYAI